MSCSGSSALVFHSIAPPQLCSFKKKKFRHVRAHTQHGLVLHAAKLFHEKAGHCLVYHANTFMAHQLILERVLESQVQHLGMPRAVRQCMLDADLPAPKVPDSDDEVCSFGGQCSDSDQDTEQA